MITVGNSEGEDFATLKPKDLENYLSGMNRLMSLKS